MLLGWAKPVPTLISTRSVADTKAKSMLITVNFSTGIRELTASDILAPGAEVVNVKRKSPSSFEFEVLPRESGKRFVELAAAKVRSYLGVSNKPSSPLKYTYEPDELLVVLSTQVGAKTFLRELPVTVRLSGPFEESGITVANFDVGNGNILKLEGTSNRWVAVVRPTGRGLVNVRFKAGQLTAAKKTGIKNSASNELAVEYDPCLECVKNSVCTPTDKGATCDCADGMLIFTLLSVVFLGCVFLSAVHNSRRGPLRMHLTNQGLPAMPKGSVFPALEVLVPHAAAMGHVWRSEMKRTAASVTINGAAMTAPSTLTSSRPKTWLSVS
jgi:hypothetical protein